MTLLDYIIDKILFKYYSNEMVSILLWPLYIFFLIIRFYDGMYLILIFQILYILSIFFKIN